MAARSRFSGGAPGGGSSDEPDMSSVGTLHATWSATDMAAYADITAMGSDGASTFHVVPVPSPVTTSSGPNTSETILTSPGRLGSGKVPHMMWPGSDQQSATFETYPEDFGNTIPDGSTHFFQFYARMTLGGTGLFVPAGHTMGVNVKFCEPWWHHNTTGGRTQFNTRYAIGTNPDTAPAVWELLDSNEVNEDSQQPVGPRPASLWDGNWHRFTAAIRPGSSTDKYQRLWIDGTKVLACEQALIGVTPPGGVKPWCTASEFARLTENDTVSKYLFGSVQTNNPDHSQDTNPWTMNVDNILWRWRSAA